MHVSSYPRALAWLLMLAGLAGGAQAVEFDEKVKAPRARAGVELKTQAESYVANFARLRNASPMEAVADKTLALDHYELKWQLERALEDKRPMEDLSAIGLEKDGNGFRINYNAFPQWNPFYETLATLMPTMDFDTAGSQFIARGFRASDIEALRSYLKTHDLKTETAERTLPLAIGFSKVVKKYDKIKRPAGRDLVFAFLYQRDKVVAETRRAWAEGLIRTLDDQRARILQSYFSEMQSMGYWSPDDVEAGVANMLAIMRLPDYEQRATAEARGVTP
jgi:hypothetical protein